jgi:ankyrin repeat protein
MADYKEIIRGELKRMWRNLHSFVRDDDDEDEQQRLVSLCNEILHYSAEIGDLKKIKLLIGQIQIRLGIEIDVNETINESSQTPLMIASGNGHADIVDFLLQNGANVNAVNRSGETALIRIAQNSIINKDVQLTIVEQLILAGSTINAQEKYGKTALILATESDSPKTVRKLLENGADISIKDDNEDTALNIAISNKMTEIETIITEYQNEPKTSAKKMGGTKKRKKNKRRKNKKSRMRKTYNIFSCY